MKKNEKKKINERIAKNKEKFLEKLREMPIIQIAANNSNISRMTIYRWIKDDKQFNKDVNEAIEYGECFVSDVMESSLIKKGRDGNVSAILAWLRSHSPKYSLNAPIASPFIGSNTFNRDGTLTSEKLKQIYEATKRWSEPPNPDEADCEIIVNSDNDESDYEVKDRGSVVEHTEEDDEDYDSKSIFDIEEEGDTRYR